MKKTKAINRTKFLSIRLSAAHLSMLRKYAASRGVTVSDACREIILSAARRSA